MNSYLSFLKGRKIDSRNSSSFSLEEEPEMEELRNEVVQLRGQLAMLQGRPEHEVTDQGTSGQSYAASEVCQVTEVVKMQAFFESDPELWFSVIESQFAARRISAEKTRYMQVVANLNCTTAALVKDIIKTQFADGHYEKLKKALIAIFGESSSEKFQKLISQSEVGSMKPSQLLHHLKSLADNTISEALVKQLWIQRLPVSSRAVLSASSENLDNLAQMADRMWEVSDRFCVSSLKSEKQVPSSTDIINALEKITDRLDALERKGRVSQRDVTPYRTRGRSPSKSRTSSAGRDDQDFCWYHAKFGKSASKCRDPCKFNTHAKN